MCIWIPSYKTRALQGQRVRRGNWTRIDVLRVSNGPWNRQHNTPKMRLKRSLQMMRDVKLRWRLTLPLSQILVFQPSSKKAVIGNLVLISLANLGGLPTKYQVFYRRRPKEGKKKCTKQEENLRKLSFWSALCHWHCVSWIEFCDKRGSIHFWFGESSDKRVVGRFSGWYQTHVSKKRPFFEFGRILQFWPNRTLAFHLFVPLPSFASPNAFESSEVSNTPCFGQRFSELFVHL